MTPWRSSSPRAVAKRMGRSDPQPIGTTLRLRPLRDERPWTLFVPLAVYTLLLGWIGLSAANVQADEFSLLIYLFANLIVSIDAIDLGLRLYAHRRHTAAAAELDHG